MLQLIKRKKATFTFNKNFIQKNYINLKLWLGYIIIYHNIIRLNFQKKKFHKTCHSKIIFMSEFYVNRISISRANKSSE